MKIFDSSEILDLLREAGDSQYSGEPVSQIEHAWQCGQLALQAGASAPLQLASWLHDIGHLMVGWAGTPTLRGEDDEHEAQGARLLMDLWGTAVAEPVRLHVAAKRYLVTKNPAYFEKLSEDSLRSLQLQGGVMTHVQLLQFESSAYARDTLQLRVWDDQGKVSGWFAPSKAQALQQLEGLMRSVPRATA